MEIEKFILKQKELLDIEHGCEKEDSRLRKSTISLQELQKRGVCIKKLHISSIRTGLYGRTILTLKLKYEDKEFPSNRFSSGDIVEILKSGDNHANAENTINGVVTKITDKVLQVALDSDDSKVDADVFDHENTSLTILKTSNEVTHRRLKTCLEKLHKRTHSKLLEICFGEATPSITLLQIPKITWFNQNLNQSQKDAIEFSLAQREIAVIHGPPGTGKTTTIVELIKQLANMNLKILACAPSNVAVDNLVEKLYSSKLTGKRKIKVVRLGHPARILSSNAQKSSLDALISYSEETAIVRDVQKDIDKLLALAKKTRDKLKRQKLYQEKKMLLKELKQREEKAMKRILSSADVILSTAVGAHDRGPLRNLLEDFFDVTVIDECGQGLETSCWIPIMQSRKCILAGDHLQLPPTVISKEAAAAGLSTSLLERIVKLHSDNVRMLNVQYRMNSMIMQWSSDNMYESKLQAHVSVFKHTLGDIFGVEITDETSLPLLMIDTAGCDMYEIEGEDCDSKGNEGEVELVVSHVEDLLKAGVSPIDIAVISPYNLQVDLIRGRLHGDYPQMEIKSVDGFQGREKEAVVLSLVRSNDKREIGFLSDNRRLNVAVTRARRHLAVICDSATVSNHNFIAGLVDYISTNGEVRSASQYSSDNDVIACYEPVSLPKKVVEKDHKLLSEEEKLKKYEKYFRKIKRFVDKSEEMNKFELNFPPSLNALERKLVHEVCEKFDNLVHESVGDGRQRHIIVKLKRLMVEVGKEEKVEEVITEEESKIIKETDLLVNKNDSHSPEVLKKCEEMCSETVEDVEDELHDKTETDVVVVVAEPKEIKKPQPEYKEEEHDKSKPEPVVDLSTCEKCGKELPSDNLDLHLVHCARLLKLKQSMQKKNEQPKQNVSKTKHNKKQKKKGKADKKSKDDDEDIDKLLEEMTEKNKYCCQSSCKNYVTTTGQQCVICKKMFCLTHHLPEIHGCGAEARASARRMISREGVIYAGSGQKNKLPKPERRRLLQKQLDDKLKTMETSRATKKKSGKT